MKRRAWIKRGGPLRSRTRLRPRSRTNSRPYEDLELRVRYRDEHPCCQLSPHLFNSKRPATDMHHIFTPRVDVWSNLCAVDRDAHDWCHRHPIQGRVLALWVKERAGEIDVDELARTRFRSVGWLETDKVVEACEGTPFEEQRVELVRWLR